ncbi:polysaccharide biosynthesis tyrosine autokinase [uncultured Ferrimonas sp.]|uniref:polysaccharide biosynthesis tyrosine autokinase n=1 Tax=uncultured Ferrimonas sp. TaxID=432640 RepID=UPI0026369C22|nr:polysaccharide biosynthesis tyrosine autokinase [uncultured Ferrimonas sp.]
MTEPHAAPDQALAAKTAPALQDDEIDLGQLLSIFRIDRWLILGGTLCACVLGILVASSIAPTYRADALIQLDQRTETTPGVDEANQLVAVESSVQTEIEVLKSRLVLGLTVDQLALQNQVTPVYLPLFGAAAARRYHGIKPAEPWLEPKYQWGGSYLQLQIFDVPEIWLGVPLRVVAEDGGRYRLLDGADNLILRGQVGQLAKANGISVLISALQANYQSEFLLTKLPRFSAIRSLAGQLQVAERGKQSNMLALSLQGQNKASLTRILDSITNNYLEQNLKRMAAQAQQSIDFLATQLPQVQTKLRRAEQALNDYQLSVQSVNVSMESQRVLDQLVGVEAEIADLEAKEAELAVLFTPEHPNFQTLSKQKQSLLERRKQMNKVVEQLPKTQQQIVRFQHDVELNQQIYLSLLKQKQELELLREGTSGTVRVLDHAQLNPAPIKPKKALIVVLATLLGAMASVAIALLRLMLLSRVDNPKQLEELGYPVLASVPQSKAARRLETQQRKRPLQQRLNGAHALLPLAAPQDLAVEALRSLHASLHRPLVQADNKVVMITGPSPNIGKSFTVANLATVMALAGQRVLVIDADLRMGYLQRAFGTHYDNGLTEYLQGNISRAEALRRSTVSNLTIIPRGAVPTNPTELLQHPRFEQLLQWANKVFDVVLIDTPPLLAVTDPSIIARHAGTRLMVLKQQHSTTKELALAQQRLQQKDAKISGLILNGIDRHAAYSGLNYYDDYQYSRKRKQEQGFKAVARRGISLKGLFS